MSLIRPASRLASRGWFVLGWTCLALLYAGDAHVQGRKADAKVLRIGTSGNLTSNTDKASEKGALESLQEFIQTETGMKNDIVRQKDWQELAEKMSKSTLDVGVFQGYEFAWATEKYPELKPLALAVNVYRYPEAYVVTRVDHKGTDFASLKGQALCLPNTGQRYLKLFVDRQVAAAGEKADKFFSKSTMRDNVEDSLDDVVDGAVQAAAVDKASLEAYKRRKPGRFKQLKEIAHSQPLPPVVIAYYDKHLDEATLQKFRNGLLHASQTDRGQTILTTFRLTGFDAPPADFSKILANARKTFPATEEKKK